MYTSCGIFADVCAVTFRLCAVNWRFVEPYVIIIQILVEVLFTCCKAARIFPGELPKACEKRNYTVLKLFKIHWDNIM